RPGRNLGFAGGCNLGARSASGDVIALVNQDAVVEPATLRRLADVALRPGVAIATASVRLAHAPDRLNSAGNDVHFLGFGWSGSYDRPATARDLEVDAVAASGAGRAARRDVGDELEGVAEEHVAYQQHAG